MSTEFAFALADFLGSAVVLVGWSVVVFGGSFWVVCALGDWFGERPALRSGRRGLRDDHESTNRRMME